MKYVTFMIILLSHFIYQTETHQVTFTNKDLSLIKLKENYWKSNVKLMFHFVSNGENGVLLTAKNIYQQLLEIKVSQKQLTVTLDHHQLFIHGFNQIKIEEGKWYKVKIKQQNSCIKLAINNLVTVLPMYRDRKWLIENWEEVYIGGLNNNSKVQHEDSKRSFSGCVEFPIHGNLTNVIEESHATMNGCIDACLLQQCDHGGKCINKYEYAYCDCKGTGYEGYSCDIKSEAISLDGSSYIKYNTEKRKPKNIELKNDIILRFKTIMKNGIILSTSFEEEFTLIELHQGVINVVVKLRRGIFHLTLGNGLNDNQWHLVVLTRHHEAIYLHLDEQTIAKTIIHDDSAHLYDGLAKEEVVIFGGVLDVKNLHYSSSQTNFTGCLQHLYYNNHDAVRKINQGTDDRYKKVGEIKPCGEEQKKTEMPVV